MKEKILILEDEIGIRSFVSINLKREGYEVIEAGCGEEAIDKIKNEKDISLALLDVMLPDMSGIEVCKYIRQNFDQVGVIMLTAKAQEEDKVEGFISGADDYMVKPFSIKVKEKILILEDEIGIRSFVSINLKREGYEVIEAGCGEEAIDKIKNEKDISLALLDVMLPDMSGIEVCKYIRQNFDQVGVIMLTAKAQEEDKVEGFISGADDYMVKPFSIKELLFRVSALLRRIKKDDTVKSNEIVSQPFTLNLDKRKLFKDGREIELTPTEFSIVKYLITNAKKSLSRDQILEEVWGSNYLYDFKIVDVNIRRIRNKIEDDPSKPKYIQTVWGYGYCFRKEE